MKRSDVGVFISYSHEDRFAADLLAQKVRDMGYLPWIDFAGMRGGEEWKKSIDLALMQSAAVIVLLTPEAVKSHWVQYEIKRALENHYTVIPLMIRTCTLPDFLHQLHYIDFRQSTDHGYRELSQALIQAVLHHGEKQYSAQPSGGGGGAASTTPATKEPEETAEVPKTRISNKPLALVIEDAESFQHLLRDILVGEGLEVHTASTRNEATSAICSHKYDFITLDMQLGPLGPNEVEGQEGIVLLELMKRYQLNVPVIMITSLDWDKNDTREFFVVNGIKDMLDKPIKPESLIRLVNQYIPSLHGAK